MIRVRITEAVLVSGVHRAVGDVIEVPDIFANYLVRIRRAVLITAPQVIETATDPGPAGAEAAVSVRRKKNVGPN